MSVQEVRKSQEVVGHLSPTESSAVVRGAGVPAFPEQAEEDRLGEVEQRGTSEGPAIEVARGLEEGNIRPDMAGFHHCRGLAGHLLPMLHWAKRPRGPGGTDPLEGAHGRRREAKGLPGERRNVH